MHHYTYSIFTFSTAHTLPCGTSITKRKIISHLQLALYRQPPDQYLPIYIHLACLYSRIYRRSDHLYITNVQMITSPVSTTIQTPRLQLVLYVHLLNLYLPLFNHLAYTYCTDEQFTCIYQFTISSTTSTTVQTTISTTSTTVQTLT